MYICIAKIITPKEHSKFMDDSGVLYFDYDLSWQTQSLSIHTIFHGVLWIINKEPYPMLLTAMP